MINVRIIGADRIVTELGAVPVKARAQLKQTFKRIGYGLQAHIKNRKLEGQVLHHRSGRLTESIHPEFFSTPNEEKVSVGTNVSYAAAHEYGFHKTVQVKEYTRKDGARVKAHDVKMNLRERSFLRTSLREYYTTAVEMIDKDIARIVRSAVK